MFGHFAISVACGAIACAGVSAWLPMGNAPPRAVITLIEKQQEDAMPEGLVRLQGQIVGGGAPCVQFLTDSGQQISLEGASHQTFEIGVRFEITGRFVQVSRCMQGRGFVVDRYAALP